ERRRSDHAPAILGIDLRSGIERHDRARDDALHGRSGVLRSDFDHGRRPDCGHRRASESEARTACGIDRRVVCETGPPGEERRADSERRGPYTVGGEAMTALRGLLRKEWFHI